jgi:hypothetical protein
MQLFEIVDVTQEMDPTPVMHTLMDGVSRVTIAAQHALELLADQAFDHFPRAGVMGLVRADGWGADTPHLSVEAIFSPPRFIGLHSGAGTDFAHERITHWLSMRVDPVKQLDDLSQTDLKAMQREQQLADVPQRQAHARAHVRNQAAQSPPNASLPKPLALEIDWCLVPFLTPRTPAFQEAMFSDLDGDGQRQIDTFSTTSQADPALAQIPVRAQSKVMLHHVRGHGSATCASVLGLALLARFFLFGNWLLHIGFDKSWRRRFLLFPFFDPRKGDMQPFPRLLQGFTQFLVFFSPLEHFFFDGHGLSVSERSRLNSFSAGWIGARYPKA